MRVKELNNKLARIAWSPYSIYPSYIACATAAEQSDLTLGTSATLDLLQLDVSNKSTDLDVVKSVNIESRCAKLIWSQNKQSTHVKNLLVSGCENASIYLYDSDLMLANSDCLVSRLEKHQSGSIGALDLNPFQNNLLASGAAGSEIFIWDLNNPSEPMTPGSKIQPFDDVTCVSWNRQVQHILASTCSGRCVVWDLRKNESIIKISENMSKLKAKLVAWHPEIATQICLSSDDDHTPYLQLWDLRFATTPVRVLEGHQRGILNFSWCSIDSNLLISSAKDSRIICWNPNNVTTNGEILYDLPTSGQWCFDVSWCQRNPDLIGASSYEGQINVYSLMGGKYNVMHQTSSKIMDSFGVGSSNPMMMPQTPPSIQQQSIPQLKIAPKWMKRPCGVSFAFGGKLVTFASNPQQPQDQQEQTVLNTQRVFINQVVTDSDLVSNSQYLESTLQTGNLVEYCNYKIDLAEQNLSEQHIWRYIQASFTDNKYEKFTQLLGFDSQELRSKLDLVLDKKSEQVNGDDLDKQLSEQLNLSNGFDSANVFDQISLNNNQQEETVHVAQKIDLNFDNEMENLLGESLLLGNVGALIDLCIKEKRFAEAILLASAFDDKDLFLKAQNSFFQNNESKFSKLVEKVITKDWEKLVSQSNLDHWKETLSLLMTYTRDQEFSLLCDSLATRLETNGQLLDACICNVCSGNLENFVRCWEKLNSKNESNADSSAELQNLIEKVVTLRYCYSRFGNPNQANTKLAKLNSKMVQYAKLLADQGCFLSAYNYLMNDESNDSSILLMKDRIFHVIDPAVIQQYRLRKPESPFFKSAQQTHQPQHQSVSRKNSHFSNQDQHSPRLHPQTAVHHPQTGLYKPVSTSAAAPPPSQPPSVNNTSPQVFFPTAPTQSKPFAPATAPTGYPLVPTPLPTPPTGPMNPVQPQTSSLMSSNSTLFTPYQQQPQPQQSSTPAMPSYMNTKPASAWNDPPIVTPKVKPPPQVSQPAEMPALFQPSMPTNSFPPATYMPQQTSVSHPPPPSMYQSQAQQYAPSVAPFQPPPPPSASSTMPQQPPVGYMNYSQAQFNSPMPPQQKPMSPTPVQAPPEQVVDKGPIAPENQVIQSTFDTLLGKCISLTNAPTAKRKLEDVSKKLDVLYDKLRSSGESAQQQLSQNVVQGIHSIVEHMQRSDYQTSLNLHSSLVAHSNFSETSAFLTGIKVLIQQCQQLNIRI